MNNNLADNLKRIRKEHNMSQEELAESLGVSRQAISKWESKAAYPEMDKILALCDKFNLNIDDLLHKDIKEVKSEEDAKRNINNYIDDFLKFITDTVNLFFNMNFKSKLKCLFEQAFIILFLWLIDFIIIYLLQNIFLDIFSFIPINILSKISPIFTWTLVLALIILSIIIVVKVFKSRYLNYYEDFKKDHSNIKEEKNTEVKEEVKVNFKEKDSKIIIRDPKDSDYHFLKGLLKIILGIVKFFSLFIVIGLSISLATLFCALVLSFLLCKTGLFFIGLIGAIISIAIINLNFLLIFINFILNRLNNKKQIIFTSIISIIILGLSVGLIFIGTLDFEVIKITNDNYITKNITLDFSDNLYFTDSDIEYIEKDIPNIILEYQTYKYCDVNYDSYNNGVYLYNHCENDIKFIKDYISKLNSKKIMEFDSYLKNIKVYASKENILKLKDNYNKHLNYYNKENEYLNKIDEYENRINELEMELDYYKQELDRY